MPTRASQVEGGAFLLKVSNTQIVGIADSWTPFKFVHSAIMPTKIRSGQLSALEIAKPAAAP
jgi:hypothetical protein